MEDPPHFPPRAERPDASILLVGAPLDASSSFRRGAAAGPVAVRRALDSVETWSMISEKDLGDAPVADAGDLHLPDEIESALEIVTDSLRQLLLAGKRIALLGGDHSVTIGAVRAASRVHPDLQVACLDAHSDWRDEYHGSRFNHACTMRRAVELCSLVRVAGVRSCFGGEDRSILVDPDDLVRELDPGRPTWLTIDADVLDPSVLGAVGNPEPGGIDYRRLLRVVEDLARLRIVGFDLVEFNPVLDPSGAGAATVAKILLETVLLLWG